MFAFITENLNLGEILAPISSPSHAFFLNIQHHKNTDAQSQLVGDPNLATVVEGGHYAIHQACRHNNLFVLELLMSRGVSVEHLDQSGNSPLHFAARYGHHDLCKFLVDRGAFAGRKNASGQTPYDVAHSHVVRQYLLPLQFQSERAEQPAAAAHGYNSYTSIGDVGAGSTGGYPPIGVPRVGSNDPQNPPAPFVGRSPAVAVVPEAELPTVPHRPHSPKAQQQQHQPAVPIGLVSTSSPPPAVTAAGTAAAGGAAAAGAAAAAVAVAPLPAAALLAQSPAGGPIAVNVGGPPTGPPVATAPLRQGIPAGGPLVGAPAVYAAPPSLPRATGGIPSSSYAEPAAPLAPGPPAFDANRRPQTNSRMIMPDGFHSSASDPELQKKYGHVKPTINIAPPPTAMPGGHGLSNVHGDVGGAGPATGGPPPFNMYSAGAPPAGFNRYVPYNPSAPNQGVYGAPVGYAQPPPAATTAAAAAPPATVGVFGPPPGPGVQIYSGASSSGGAVAPLGGAPLAPAAASLRPTHHAIPQQQQQQQQRQPPLAYPSGPPRPINVFDPATDTDVTTLSSSSSSVL